MKNQVRINFNWLLACIVKMFNQKSENEIVSGEKRRSPNYNTCRSFKIDWVKYVNWQVSVPHSLVNLFEKKRKSNAMNEKNLNGYKSQTFNVFSSIQQYIFRSFRYGVWQVNSNLSWSIYIRYGSITVEHLIKSIRPNALFVALRARRTFINSVYSYTNTYS